MSVAVVLGGGGTRGAYEAGALSVLVPALAERGEAPAIFTGTSAGSINAAYLATGATEGADLWTRIRYRDALEPLLPGGAGRAAEYLADALGIPGARLWSLLDPAPLRRTLAERVDFDAIQATAAVATTAVATGRTVVFHTADASPPPDEGRGIDYVRARLTVDHVMASSAIPTVFPAVQIDGDWYVDGGTRLNTPIKPALALGAEKVLVVAISSPLSLEGRPDALAAAALVLRGLLEDQLLADVRTLAALNGVPGRRTIPHAVITPSADIGAIARRVFDEHYRGLLDSLRSRDVAVLGRAVGNPELLSYLFVAPEFTRELADLGAADARAWLDAHPDVWVE